MEVCGMCVSHSANRWLSLTGILLFPIIRLLILPQVNRQKNKNQGQKEKGRVRSEKRKIKREAKIATNIQKYIINPLIVQRIVISLHLHHVQLMTYERARIARMVIAVL